MPGSNPSAVDQRAGGRIELVLIRAFGQLARNRLAELNPELVERVDAEKHRVGERAMFVKCDQRTERTGIEPVEQNRRAWAISWISALRVVARAALHQGGALCEGIQQQ